jgi:CRP/FNR family transcriptional regulator, anaerobic regulatory protein
MSKLIDYLCRFFKIDDYVADDLMAITTRTTHKKGETLVKLGEISERIYFLERGLVRGYYCNSQGEDFTSWMHVNNGVFSSFRSYMFGEPSRVAIEFLEDSTVLSVTRAELEALCEKHLQLLQVRVIVLQELNGETIEHNRMLQSMDASERYAHFAERYPHLLQRVNLGHIATFLGINQATLSRIRAKHKTKPALVH